MLESLRPDPTLYASPRLAMEAEPEHIAYTALLSPDRLRPDALAVVDVDSKSKTFGSSASPHEACGGAGFALGWTMT